MSMLVIVAYALLVGAVACGVGAVLYLLEWWTYDGARDDVDRDDCDRDHRGGDVRDEG